MSNFEFFAKKFLHLLEVVFKFSEKESLCEMGDGDNFWISSYVANIYTSHDWSAVSIFNVILDIPRRIAFIYLHLQTASNITDMTEQLQFVR